MTPDALIAYVVTELFEQPSRLVVTYGEATVVLEVFAADGTLGHLIGRRGQMAQALRELARAVGSKHGLRVYLSVEGE